MSSADQHQVGCYEKAKDPESNAGGHRVHSKENRGEGWGRAICVARESSSVAGTDTKGRIWAVFGCLAPCIPYMAAPNTVMFSAGRGTVRADDTVSRT